MRKTRNDNGNNPLRRKAEDQLNSNEKKKNDSRNKSMNSSMDESDIQKLVHELQVHQIELEMQNEELMNERELNERLLENYTMLYDFAPMGYFTLDSGGRIKELNLRGAEMLARDRSSLIEKDFTTFVHVDSLSVFNAFLTDIFQSKEKGTCDIKLRQPSGNFIFAHIVGNPVDERRQNCLINVTDITELKLAGENLRISEEKLKHSEESFKIALKYSPVSVFIKDRKLRYTWVFQSVFDIPNDKFIGRTDYELFQGEDLEQISEIKTSVIKTGKPRRKQVKINLGGQDYYFDMSVEPLFDDMKEISGVVCAMVDVTDLVQLETDRKKQTSEMVLERSARLDSFGLMAGGITHELNQPLNAIRIGADGILLWNKRSKNVLPEIISEMISDISKSVNRVDAIIKNMKSFINNSINEKLEIFNINDTIKKALSMFDQKIKNHMITLNLDLYDPSLYVKADQLRMELVMNNLIINAIHALDHKSIKNKFLKIRSFLEHEKALIIVEDNGIGLPTDIPKERLFEPFLTTKGAEGSGLGLAIAKTFLEKYDATIDTQNNEYGGATFTLCFNKVETGPA